MLEDPELKSQIMELEALRQSKISKSESGTKPYIKPLEESFVMEQDKHKEVRPVFLAWHSLFFTNYCNVLLSRKFLVRCRNYKI